MIAKNQKTGRKPKRNICMTCPNRSKFKRGWCDKYNVLRRIAMARYAKSWKQC